MGPPRSRQRRRADEVRYSAAIALMVVGAVALGAAACHPFTPAAGSRAAQSPSDDSPTGTFRSQPGTDPTQVASDEGELEGPATFEGPAGIEARWMIEENAKRGTAAWKIQGPDTGTIAGFANRSSAQVGDEVTLYVTTNAPIFTVYAYRMGYYGGAGARLIWTSSPTAGVTQPDCPLTPGTNMVACDDWSPSLQVQITAAFVQGDYLFKLVGSGDQQSYIPLTVWDPASRATYLVENDIYTWQAWNPYGGYDFYAGEGPCPPDVYPLCSRARVVSFDRPYGYGNGAADFLWEEYPFVRFAEQHGLDVTYATSADFEQDPGFLAEHRAVLSLGHDECWSMLERQALEHAEQHGVNVVFLGASAMLRHVRLQTSPMGADREEVDYRDASADPLDGEGQPLQVTGNTWSAPPASWSEVPFVGGNYTGFLLPGARPAPLVVTDASSWLFRGTGLTDGSEVPDVLFSDFDQYDPGLSPSNVTILAHSPLYGFDLQTNVADPASDITYYTDPRSDAGVFDSGTVAWVPDLGGIPVVAKMTANVLRLFGTGPAALLEPSTANWARFYRL